MPLVSSIVLLFAVSSGEIVLDRESGVWFPPYASREVYLYGNDPAHPFSGDVKKAFDADPQLAQRVCAAVIAWKPIADAASNPALRQKKAMLDMLCTAKGYQRRVEDEEAQAVAAARPRLEREFHIATGAVLDDVGRQLTPADERLRKALAMVAEYPSNSGPADELIAAVEQTGCVPTAHGPGRVVIEFYKTRATADDRYDWLSGYRYALFYGGDYAQSRAVMETIFAGPDAKKGDYDPLFLALLDRIDGHPARYEQLLRNCPKPSEAEVEALYGYEEPEIHCRAWVETIAARAVRISRERVAPALKDVIRENAGSRYLIIAVNAARDEAQFDPDSARRHFQRILDLPEDEVPSGIRSDAELGLKRLR